MGWFKTESNRNLIVIAVVIACTTAFLFYTAQRSTNSVSAAQPHMAGDFAVAPAATK